MSHHTIRYRNRGFTKVMRIIIWVIFILVAIWFLEWSSGKTRLPEIGVFSTGSILLSGSMAFILCSRRERRKWYWWLAPVASLAYAVWIAAGREPAMLSQIRGRFDIFALLQLLFWIVVGSGAGCSLGRTLYGSRRLEQADLPDGR